MLFQKSPFSGSVINYRIPCTSSEGRLCNIFADLPLWNEFFCQVGLELREVAPGQLSLVEMRHAGVQPNILEQQEAATLLCNLLSHHRCIVTVHLHDHVFKCHHQLICDALRNSPSLRKLKLCRLNMTTQASQSFAAVLQHLNQLQELDFSDVAFNRTSPEGISEFLARTRSLTNLTMTDQRIEGKDAVAVLQGLRQNVTISTLSLHANLLSMVSSRCGDIFADYLRCNKTLRILTVTSSSRLCFNDLRPIIGPLFYNNNLSELNLIGFSIHMRNNKIITDMLSRNRGLRRFNMVNCIFYEYDPFMNTWVPVSSCGPLLILSWLAALAKNNTLKELTLDLSWIKPEDCSSFFRALASNTSLKKINVPTFRQNDVAQLCRALRDTGVPERFFVGQHHILKDTAASLSECRALSRIRLYRCTRDEVVSLHTTLCLLPTCTHVNSLCLEITGEMFNGKVNSLLAHYLTETTTLKELRLYLHSGTGQAFDKCERTLLQALSTNKSIRRLSLKGMCISESEASILVDALQSSRTLCHLSFYPYNCDASIWVILMLLPNISSNYMLLGLRTSWYERPCGSWCPIKDVVRRNNSLVTRAAHFVMGMRHKYCAAAAERMQFNPGLVEKVQELSSVEENEAVSLIKSNMKSFTELDDFMCVAGVVKYSVICNRRDDRQKQLVDLNRDCWLHVRQFLKLSDILNPK
ncbi:hypothetical protein HPB52_003993 [Rhipicephalus sanguineus]|uniref:Nlr family card domain protein n=1 Tax=Rhipicephalus sanguineus TaxID=34632 RepID=A0A9D4PJ44_RHISA|nr:hypothetical protein HPB52_003993 [Rhipicephalus sanguineus]